MIRWPSDVDILRLAVIVASLIVCLAAAVAHPGPTAAPYGAVATAIQAVLLCLQIADILARTPE